MRKGRHIRRRGIGRPACDAACSGSRSPQISRRGGCVAGDVAGMGWEREAQVSLVDQGHYPKHEFLLGGEELWQFFGINVGMNIDFYRPFAKSDDVHPWQRHLFAYPRM